MITMKKITFNLAIYALLAFLLACNQGHEKVTPENVGLSSDTLALVDAAMQKYIDDGKVSCVSVVLIKNGKTIINKNFGHRDMESGDINAEKTIFRIYSMTKPVTAAALMMLYDEGKFKLDDEVSMYIPEFKETMVYTPDGDGFKLVAPENGMTVRHLLTHTSGISYGWNPNSYVDSLYKAEGVSAWDTPIGKNVKKLAKIPFNFQPGTKWSYGLSIDVAGYLVEVLSGMPLDEFMKTRLFKPLGMVDTDFYVPEEKHNRLAYLYYRDAEHNLTRTGQGFGMDVNEIYKKPTVHFSGGGGLVSTADDYAKFCKMLLNGGELGGVRLLEEATVKLIMTDQMPKTATFREGYGYGLGGDVNLKSGEYSWAGAGSTNFWIDPSNDMTIMAFTQLMPAWHGYAYEFKDIVTRSIINQ